MTRPSGSQQKKKKDNRPNCGLYRPADHNVKLKESELRDKYEDLARELKKL